MSSRLKRFVRAWSSDRGGAAPGRVDSSLYSGGRQQGNGDVMGRVQSDQSAEVRRLKAQSRRVGAWPARHRRPVTDGPSTVPKAFDWRIAILRISPAGRKPRGMGCILPGKGRPSGHQEGGRRPDCGTLGRKLLLGTAAGPVRPSRSTDRYYTPPVGAAPRMIFLNSGFGSATSAPGWRQPPARSAFSQAIGVVA